MGVDAADRMRELLRRQNRTPPVEGKVTVILDRSLTCLGLASRRWLTDHLIAASGAGCAINAASIDTDPLRVGVNLERLGPQRH